MRCALPLLAQAVNVRCGAEWPTARGPCWRGQLPLDPPLRCDRRCFRVTAPALSGEKILVTGAAGQIGLPMVEWLARENEVWGAARFRAGRWRRW